MRLHLKQNKNKTPGVSSQKVMYMENKNRIYNNPRTLPSLRGHMLEAGSSIHIKDTTFSLNFGYCAFQL